MSICKCKLAFLFFAVFSALTPPSLPVPYPPPPRPRKTTRSDPKKGEKEPPRQNRDGFKPSLHLFFFTHSDRTMNGSRRKNRTTYTGFTSLHPAGLTALEQLPNASRRSVLIREAVNFNGVSAVSAGVCGVVIPEIMGPDVPAVAFVRDLPTATAQSCGKCLVIGHIYAPFRSAV